MVGPCTCCLGCTKHKREIQLDGTIIDCHKTCMVHLLETAVWELAQEEIKRQKELDRFHNKMARQRRRKK